MFEINAWAAVFSLVTPSAPTAKPAPPATLKPAGWCAIAGSLPYGRFSRAITVRDKVRAVGVTAGLYDTRDFHDLAWGQLAVIAGGVADKATAKATVKALKAASRPAYARKCTPHKAGATPLDAQGQLAARARLSSSPWAVPGKLLPGCFAWSSKKKAALCLNGASTQIADHLWGDERPVANADWALEIAGKPLVKLPEPSYSANAFALNSTLQKAARSAVDTGGLVSLAGLETLTLRPGSTRRLGSPRLAIRWKRVHSAQINNGYGLEGGYKFPVWLHTIEFKCGNGYQPLFPAFISGAAGDEEDVSGGRLVIIPGDQYVVITRNDRWFRPNHYSRSHKTRVLDLKAVCGD